MPPPPPRSLRPWRSFGNQSRLISDPRLVPTSVLITVTKNYWQLIQIWNKYNFHHTVLYQLFVNWNSSVKALISRHGWVGDVVPESAYNTLLSPLPRREWRGGGGALNKVIYTGRLCSKFRPKFCQNFHFWQKKNAPFVYVIHWQIVPLSHTYG